MSVEHVEVRASEAGMRLDRWFKARYPGLAFARLQKLVRTGQVRVDGGRVKPGRALAEGEVVRVPPLDGRDRERPRFDARPEDAARMRKMALYEDDALIAIAKPPGLASQGGGEAARHVDGMAAALATEAEGKPRLVHRLDQPTSGVLVLAKTADAARILTKAFRGREVRKLYWALVRGKPDRADGVIDLAIEKAGDRVSSGTAAGKRARTGFRVIAQAGKVGAWVGLMPHTGRTHQLRAHCAAIGCPIFGDDKYGATRGLERGGNAPPGLMLHARAIAFAHPMTGRAIELEAPPPPSFVAGMDWLGVAPAGQTGSLLAHWKPIEG